MIPVTETTLVLDLEALTHNYQHLRKLLPHGVRFMAVVKAFAYGSDAAVMALKLQDLGADYFAVAYTAEGIALRKSGITAPILVLHPLPAHFSDLIEYCLEPALYSHRVLEAFATVAAEKGLTAYPIQLKFNTGLNRLGFRTSEATALGRWLGAHPELKLSGAFSHLVASEDHRVKSFILSQLAAYTTAVNLLRKELTYDFLRHALNTSGILNFGKEYAFDMVRSGIGLYGFGNEAVHDAQLKPVAQLWSVISQIHELQPGESVGYNFGFTATQPMRTATIPLGHADGISRIYGKGKGWLRVRGQNAPILGNVCMDMLMIDVTGIPCEEGEAVEIFGRDTRADDLAAAAGTISYELITAISQRVKREIIG